MTGTPESPESRLYAAGFTRQLEFWLSPDGHRVLSLGDALAALDSGEINPVAGVEFPDSGVRAWPDELVDRICPRPQPAGEPPAWQVAQTEVIAAATVEKLKPLIRAEVRAALQAANRSQQRATAEAPEACPPVVPLGPWPQSIVTVPSRSRSGQSVLTHFGTIPATDKAAAWCASWLATGSRHDRVRIDRVLLGGMTDGAQGWDAWPIDPARVAEGARRDADRRACWPSTSSSTRLVGTTPYGRPIGSAAARTFAGWSWQ